MEIYKAIANLPEELITQAIADAAIDEGNIELLNSLPHRFLSGEVIMSIIGKNEGKYIYKGFDLKNIPENLRAKEVCEYAVKKDNDNILHTPKEHLSPELLAELLSTTERNLKYLHMFLDEVWTADLLLQGVKSIYTKTTQQYGPRGGHHGTKTTQDIKPVLIFMSYVPDNLKTSEFYASLFDTRMTMEDIEAITPKAQRDKAFYLKVAAKDFEVVPRNYYDYDIFLAAIENKQFRISYDGGSTYNKSRAQIEFEKEEADILREKVFEVMDAHMADAVVTVRSTDFRSLPSKFHSAKRLILAIQNSEKDKIIGLEGNEKLFTEAVCKAYISRNRDLPTLPDTIWTDDFVEFCMEHGTEFNWFEQLPKQMQTLEIVERAMNHWIYNARHVREDLITLERAHQLFRDGNRNQSYVPVHYLKEFESETGLSQEFFGGEVSYDVLRESRKNHTYCRIGHCFIGFHCDGYSKVSSYIILTRRTPSSFKPVQVFEREVQTFHTTWLEKIITDNDLSYTKPTISKALKPYSINAYFSLKKVASVDGADIYANNILGGTAYYTALIGDERISSSSLDEVKEQLKPIDDSDEEVAA